MNLLALLLTAIALVIIFGAFWYALDFNHVSQPWESNALRQNGRQFDAILICAVGLLGLVFIVSRLSNRPSSQG